MEKSLLYNLLEHNVINKMRDEIEQADELKLKEEAERYKQTLETVLNNDQKELFTRFELALSNMYDQIIYELSVKTLNLGIAIGVDLQNIFKNS